LESKTEIRSMLDFDRDHLEEFRYGIYEELDPSMLPPLYLAYRTALSEGTEVVHNDLRERWDRGDADVRAGMARFGEITDLFYQALKQGDQEEMSRLVNANFDLRAELCPISAPNQELISAARNVEASAKFSGSGGAIIGTYRDAAMFDALRESMREIGAELIEARVGRTT